MGDMNQGEYVAIEFTSADAQTAAAITLKDANDVARTLKSYERLLIDTLQANLAAGITADMFADAANTGVVDATETVVSFSPNAALFEGGVSGWSVPVGLTPKIKASGAGSVKVLGNGRIILGTTQGNRPNWREANFGQ